MAHEGVVKSFNELAGWGFIVSEQGEDVFVHAKDTPNVRPKKDLHVRFDIETAERKEGGKVAKNLRVVPGSCQGVVKSFVNGSGYGFINHEGGEVFLHINDVVEGRPVAGDTVNFEIDESIGKEGQKTAKFVTGGSAHLEEASKAKGKGGKDGYGKVEAFKGKGMDATWNQWGMSDGMSWGPYGKGKDGAGFGKGGMGKDGMGGKGWQAKGGKDGWDMGAGAWSAGKGGWDAGKGGSWDAGKGGSWDAGKGGSWDAGKGGSWDAGKGGSWDAGKGGSWDAGKGGSWDAGKGGSWDAGKGGSWDAGKGGSWDAGKGVGKGWDAGKGGGWDAGNAGKGGCWGAGADIGKGGKDGKGGWKGGW
eukprot:TRINITY_DN506_c0_g1_i4.p1 TRINITY_DN506_c0_g1~~TRINITY_DN506_c0_g1_i4.p1  ORF type:complete len:374 (-),score=99.08 TRINITY_DN506_c0_g1_i4:166-1245(-)